MHVQTSIPTTSAPTPVATAVAKPNSTQQVKAPIAAAPAKAAVVKPNAPVAVAAKASTKPDYQHLSEAEKRAIEQAQYDLTRA